jgi:uncharacterized protein YaeQ
LVTIVNITIALVTMLLILIDCIDIHPPFLCNILIDKDMSWIGWLKFPRGARKTDATYLSIKHIYGYCNPMALGSTVYNFEIALADSTRNTYESLSLRVGKHPSETFEYLLCRVLAYCLEYQENLEFTTGLQDPEMPAIWAKDLTGQVELWVEVGAPSAEKLHKASKKVERVVIYTHKNPELLTSQLHNQTIYKSEEIKIFSFDDGFVKGIAEILERRNIWNVSVNEDVLYLDIGSSSFTTNIHSCGVCQLTE